MSSAWSTPLRAFATQTAVITMIGLGFAAPASAAQGGTPSDNANDTATTAQAEASAEQSARAEDRAVGSTSTSGPAKVTAPANSSTKPEPQRGPDHSQGNAGTSGDAGSPQPLSTADQNPGGANGQCPGGPYCSTRNGSASLNGKGEGEAVGKPCAGCVGRADNKNPQGQFPNGSDHNKGYECDDNQGIGQSNPAHTRCTVTTTVTPPVVTPPTVTPPTVTPPVVTPPRPPAVVPPGIGGVDTEVPTSNRPPTVAGVEMVRPPAEAAPQAVPGAAVLPATGSSSATTALSALALAMLVLGSGLLLYRRVTA